MILSTFFLLSSLAYPATSTLINLDPTALNRIIPHCFTPSVDPDIPEANLRDCRDALSKLARTEDFTIPRRYSKNSRRGRPLPLGWSSGNCLIMVSCENENDAYTFRFADVLPPARQLVETCVGTETTQGWGLLRWGGVDVLGDSVTFYVTVFRPKNPIASTGTMAPVTLVNETLNHSAIEVSRKKSRR